MNTDAFHALSYGLYLICAVDADGRKVGCVANTFAQVASEPITASVSLNKQNATTQAILASGRYTAVCLTTDADMELIGRFGFKGSRDIDKFDETPYETDRWGVPYVTAAANARFSVEVSQTVDAGSHLVFIGEVIDADTLADAESMTYAYYHTVLRGKTPPKAAGYIKESEALTEGVGDIDASDDAGTGVRYGWRCKVCGYIEEGYPDGLPADYTCPWCGAGAEMFERIEL